MEVLVPKKTGTYADALCAVGYATLLAELRQRSARIEDVGNAYRVSCPKGVAIDDWQPPSAKFLFICRKSKDRWPPAVGPILDYEKEKAIADAGKKSSGSAKAKQKVEEALEEISDAPAAGNDPEYRFCAIIESMRKGWMSDKALFSWIADHPDECLQIVKERVQGRPAELKTEWSNSQILNPSTGKGVHASKTIAKSAGGFNLVDTFDEWMKLRGLWAAMLGFRSGEDFKFFVIDPGDISSEHIEKLRIELRNVGMWGVVRLDIEAVLRLLQILMLRSEAIEPGGIPVLHRTPNRIVRGLQLAFFKSLGTAAALMNDSLLPLPSWFAVETRDDVNAYLEICQEPFGKGTGKGDYGPLSALQEKHSDDVELLQKYRRWLMSGELPDLLDFHANFAVHLLQKLATNEFAPQFRVPILHLLLLKGYPQVNEIIESPGFQSIARAIRNTTIYAVGMKSSNREVRFGLAQKWKQRIKSGDAEFLAELSDFVQQQNWEVVNRLKGKGYQVSAADLDDVVRLTAKYHAELVGMLLLAYGFSRAEAVGTKDDVEAEQAVTV